METPVKTTAGTLAEFIHRGQAVMFFAQDVDDIIQREHVAGRFYELEELAIIEAHFPKGGSYVDIGANVGNHVVFVSKFCGPSQIVAVEPNVSALRLLNINLALNAVRATIMPFGLSDVPSRAEARWPTQNLGGARMFSAENGRVRMVPGDDLFSGRRVDFMKIDVETLELAVLTGLANTIAANRPQIFIEVDDANRQAMDAWIASNRYHVASKHRRYGVNENLMLTPL